MFFPGSVVERVLLVSVGIGTRWCRFRRTDPLGVTTVYERGSGVLVATEPVTCLPLVQMYTGESSERQGSGRTRCRES